MRPYCFLSLLVLCVAVLGCSRVAGTLPSTQGNPNSVSAIASLLSGNGVYSRSSAPPSFSVLYSFGKRSDGVGPNADLIAVAQSLYGTTRSGGRKGKGTVFELANGNETLLHSFTGKPDGGHPWAGLVSLNGIYYGTTEYGGTGRDGTVFSIDQSGHENVVYSFQGGADGVRPLADLVVFEGALYGTTATGGAADDGTVFKVTPGGVETVLHTFAGGTDGVYPTAPLVELGGSFYGTTKKGGSKNEGAVFTIKPDGTGESALYSFQGGADGAAPIGGLTVLRGSLYGTTYRGGLSDRGGIFEVTTGGSEHVVHAFRRDEGLPFAGLTLVKNKLYGTTLHGGKSKAGTVFKLEPRNGKLTVLHTFSGGADGYAPAGRLMLFNGSLVGTARYGGTANLGTIYSVAP